MGDFLQRKLIDIGKERKLNNYRFNQFPTKEVVTKTVKISSLNIDCLFMIFLMNGRVNDEKTNIIAHQKTLLTMQKREY